MEGDARLTQIAAPGCETRLVIRAADPRPAEGPGSSGGERTVCRGQEIYAPDDPADHWYRSSSGMARKCAVTADGRRQIVDFLLPGDFFGLITRHEAPLRRRGGHRWHRRGALSPPARRAARRLRPRIGRRIREAAFEAISRSQARMIILGRMSAQGKVGAFLLEMAERSRDAAAGRGPVADVALRHRRLSRPCRRDGQPHAVGPQAERRDQVRGHAPDPDRRPRRPRGRSRTIGKRAWSSRRSPAVRLAFLR